MDNQEIKLENRKMLPRFILIMIICLLIGGGIGFCAAKYGLNLLTDGLKSAGAFFEMRIAPWLMLALAVAVPVVCGFVYRSAKSLLASWDGEDEAVSDAIDQKLSIAVWMANAAMILSSFFLAASYSGGFQMFEHKENTLPFLVSLAAFFGIMIGTTIIQQKCVDAARKTNPEKTVSVYDPKFQKKWMDTCDEAEKLMIGRCAYKAYAVTNGVCLVLAEVLAICALVFGIGFLPSLAVCLIWIVNMSVYCKEAIKYSKAGNKIS